MKRKFEKENNNSNLNPSKRNKSNDNSSFERSFSAIERNEDILSSVTPYLTSAELLTKFSLISKTCNQVSKINFLWETRIKNEFNILVPKEYRKIEPYNIYKSLIKLEKIYKVHRKYGYNSPVWTFHGFLDEIFNKSESKENPTVEIKTANNAFLSFDYTFRLYNDGFDTLRLISLLEQAAIVNNEILINYIIENHLSYNFVNVLQNIVNNESLSNRILRNALLSGNGNLKTILYKLFPKQNIHHNSDNMEISTAPLIYEDVLLVNAAAMGKTTVVGWVLTEYNAALKEEDIIQAMTNAIKYKASKSMLETLYERLKNKKIVYYVIDTAIAFNFEIALWLVKKLFPNQSTLLNYINTKIPKKENNSLLLLNQFFEKIISSGVKLEGEEITLIAWLILHLNKQINETTSLRLAILEAIAESGNLHRLEWFIKYIDNTFLSNSDDLKIIFKWAAKADKLELIKFIAEYVEKDITSATIFPNLIKEMCLIATEEGSISVLQWILALNKFELDIETFIQMVEHAVDFGYYEIFQFLFTKYPKFLTELTPVQKDDFISSVLRTGNLKAFQFLEDSIKHDFTLSYKSMCDAINTCNVELIKHLIDQRDKWETFDENFQSKVSEKLTEYGCEALINQFFPEQDMIVSFNPRW